MSKITRIVLPPQDYLLSRLRYEAETGCLFWLPIEVKKWPHRSWNRNYSGKPALNSLNAYGYLHGTIDRKSVLAHRVIWKILHGTDPDYIDHLNSDRTDNRPENLRSVTARENQRNQKLQSRNKSGVVGVCFDKTNELWLATICDDCGAIVRLGGFLSFDDAVASRKAAEIRYGYHELHGAK